MTSSERLGHLLVAIPVAHILGSAFYLWSYCLGFGANLVFYASATDLLSVSISDMVKVYCISLVLPLVILASRLTTDHPYATDMANALPADQQPKAHSTISFIRKFINIFALVVFLFFGTILIWNTMSGKQFSYLTFWSGLQIPLVIAWMGFSERRGFSNYTFEAGAILLGFIISLFSTGGANGQSDRFVRYADARMTHTSCMSAVVLRQLSGKYLAVLPDNSRALISDDCKVKITIPPARGLSPYVEPAKPQAKPHATKPPEQLSGPPTA